MILNQQGKPVRICTKNAPQAIKQWLKARQFEYPPKKLDRDHPSATIHWYKTLQPPSRISSWPPPQKSDTRDWLELRKFGPQGVFLVLMALSWFPLDVCAVESYKDLKLILADLKWIISTLDSDNQDSLSGRKRKNQSSSSTASSFKKKRK